MSPNVQMSKYLSKTKSKKALIDQTEALYHILDKQSKLNRRLKFPETYQLLYRIQQGFASCALANKFAESYNSSSGEIIAGPLAKVLDATFPPNRIHSLRTVSLPDKMYDSCSVVASLHRGAVQLSIKTPLKEYPLIRHYRPGMWIFAVREGVEELPMDLRNWSEAQLKYYLENYGDLRGHPGASARPQRKRSASKNFLLDSMHKMRRVNISPSKAQKRRVEEEIARNNLQVDESFSYDE